MLAYINIFNSGFNVFIKLDLKPKKNNNNNKNGVTINKIKSLNKKIN